MTHVLASILQPAFVHVTSCESGDPCGVVCIGPLWSATWCRQVDQLQCPYPPPPGCLAEPVFSLRCRLLLLAAGTRQTWGWRSHWSGAGMRGAPLRWGPAAPSCAGSRSRPTSARGSRGRATPARLTSVALAAATTPTATGAASPPTAMWIVQSSCVTMHPVSGDRGVGVPKQGGGCCVCEGRGAVQQAHPFLQHGS
jgi:hypothetical protein